jgi:hypothetical protein
VKAFLVLFGFLLFGENVFADDGDHLIYRCDEGHWECVNEAEFRNCRESRDKEIKEEKKDLSCAEFEHHPSLKGCEQRILFLTTHNFGTRFCLNDSFRKKSLSF